MTRSDLVDRLEVEQKYWHRKMNQHRMTAADWTAYREVYTVCLHMIDPAEAVSDTLAWAQGRVPTGQTYLDRRPCDDEKG